MISLSTKKRLTPSLLAMPNVVGVGIRKGNLAVYVEKLTKEIQAKISANVFAMDIEFGKKDYKIEIVETGKIVAHKGREEFWRPVYGGLSTGPEPFLPGGGAGIGTIGASFIDNTTGGRVLLSNNHVFARKDTIQHPIAKKGNMINQPGGSAPTVGYLERWITLDEEKINIIDAAIVKPVNQEDAGTNILQIGNPNGIANPFEGETVRKSGRTTGLSTGVVSDVNATVRVDYGEGRGIIDFEDQIIVERISGDYPMSCGGDSGSVVVNQNNEIIGLLFAGPTEVYNYYVANKIMNITNLLDISPIKHKLKLTKEDYKDYEEEFTVEEAGIKDFNINLEPTEPPPCNCTPWQDAECISETQRRQTRTCDPSGCDVEERIVDDAGCSTEPPPKKKFPYWTLLGIPLIAIPLLAKGEKKKK